MRLFANMFAGHMLLLVFTLGGFAMLSAERLARAGLGAVLGDGHRADLPRVRWSSCLQAYVFTVLTASYVQGALADEH